MISYPLQIIFNLCIVTEELPSKAKYDLPQDLNFTFDYWVEAGQRILVLDVWL